MDAILAKMQLVLDNLKSSWLRAWRFLRPVVKILVFLIKIALLFLLTIFILTGLSVSETVKFFNYISAVCSDILRWFLTKSLPLKVSYGLFSIVFVASMAGLFAALKDYSRAIKRSNLQRVMTKFPSPGAALSEKILAGEILAGIAKGNFETLKTMPIAGHVVDNYLDYRFGTNLFGELSKSTLQYNLADLPKLLSALSVWDARSREVDNELRAHINHVASIEANARSAKKFVDDRPHYFDSAVNNFVITVRQVVIAAIYSRELVR